MKRIFTYTYMDNLTKNNADVEDFLLSLGYSRHLIIDLKKDPTFLTIDGKQVYTTHKLVSGEVLQVILPEDTPSEGVVASDLPLNIVYEDNDILVINKAANVPIHPSQGNFANSLANGVTWYYMQKGEPFTCRIINRLDRDTTGLLVIAKHALSACILSDMVRNRQIHRTYLAAVKGDLAAAPEGVAGTICAPIARVDGSTIERKVDFVCGETAITHYRQLFYLPEIDSSMVELKLETGRTHQIRVHMKHLGFPLYGDFLYNPDNHYIARQSLHSWKLAFSHPITKEPLAFRAAVPDDMKLFTKGREDLLDNDF